MRSFLLSIACAVVLAATAQAHFVFIVPDAASGKVIVVLSEDLKPDPAVPTDNLTTTKLFVGDGAKKPVEVKWEKGENQLAATIPAGGDRTVFGSTTYGVFERKGVKPFLLIYYPKAIVGDVAKAPRVDGAKVELVPEITGGEIRFRLFKEGKPAADVEVNLMEPNTDAFKAVCTSAEGRTPAFKTAGRYAAWAKIAEPGEGEHQGKKFAETRRYATLVVDMAAGK